MFTFNFYIKNKKAKSKTIILLFFSYQKDRVKLSTGLSIAPQYWNAKKQRARLTFPHAIDFNQELEKIEAKIMKLYSELKDKKDFCIGLLRQWFLGINKKPNPQRTKRVRVKKDFHWFVKKYIDEIEFTKSRDTHKRAISIYKMLCDFETWRGNFRRCQRFVYHWLFYWVAFLRYEYTA